jgi:hypothetical protein
MRDGGGVDVWRFRASFTLDAPDRLVRMHDGHDDGHHLLAVRAGSQAAAALVADAAACGGHASGLPADQAVPYFVEVWPPVLATILQTPASRLRWLFVDAAGGLRDVSAAQDRDGPGQRQSLRAMLAQRGRPGSGAACRLLEPAR